MVDNKIDKIMKEYKSFREQVYMEINELKDNVLITNEQLDNLLIILGEQDGNNEAEN